MEAEQIFEVVEKLTGPVHPCGESSVDKDRLQNLKKFMQVFNEMHAVIDDIAHNNKDSPYHSERKIGELANKQIELMRIEY